jgi:hypothetical protein
MSESWERGAQHFYDSIDETRPDERWGKTYFGLRYVVAILEDNESLGSVMMPNPKTILNSSGTPTEHYCMLKSISLINGTRASVDRRWRRKIGWKQTAGLGSQEQIRIGKPSGSFSIELNDPGGDIGAILRLNWVRRQYLIQNGVSVSQGVEVLSAVNDDLNCVRENPKLCIRSAVETAIHSDIKVPSKPMPMKARNPADG